MSKQAAWFLLLFGIATMIASLLIEDFIAVNILGFIGGAFCVLIVVLVKLGDRTDVD